MGKIQEEMLGIASEFAVASELGRRKFTLNRHLVTKRTDLLIFGDRGNLLKVEAKGKQGKQWPNCKAYLTKIQS